METQQGLTHVIIVGGGPAGTSCALKLRLLASEMGKPVQVTILESKQFRSEQHYNQCVGVLSPPLPELLERDLDVQYPQHLSRTLITGYVVHSQRAHVTLDDDHVSHALRRVQYDAYMLEEAKSRGVNVISARAVDIEFNDSGVVVYTDSLPVTGDVVVGAFGLDEGCASIFSRNTKYRPPDALDTVVTKLHPGQEAMDAFGTRIHAFLPSDPRIEFGGITPKGNHLTLNIAGRHVDSPLMQNFIQRPDVRHIIPGLEREKTEDPDDLRFFKGRFPCSQARGYYGERYVLVGDASGLVRSFKGKGVTSAIQTGIRAAETILKHGYSYEVFHSHFRAANFDITRDLPYGRIMRLITIWFSRIALLDAVIRASNGDPDLRSALIGAVSGNTPYQQILLEVLRPGPMGSILASIAGRGVNGRTGKKMS